MKRLQENLGELKPLGKYKTTQGEPETPSTVQSPISTLTHPSEVMFNGLRRDNSNWELYSIEPADPLEGIRDTLAPSPETLRISRDLRFSESRKIGKQKQAPVNTVLGLMHVRFAEVNIRRIPLSDIRIAAILSGVSFHSPDCIGLSPLVSRMVDASNERFPQGVVPAETTDAQAMVWFFKADHSVFISFRGNHDIDRFFKNMGLLDTKQHGEDSSNALRGMVEDFRRIEVFLRPILQEVIPQASQVVCVGAGLGGGLATIAAPFFGQLFDRKVDCITFGAPKVGNVHFAGWYKSIVGTSIRVVSSSDPLPHMPLNRPDLVHVSDSLCLSKRGYMESWGKSIKISPKVVFRIENISFDDFRWEAWATKYRKMVLAVIGRYNKGLTTIIKHEKLDRGRV